MREYIERERDATKNAYRAQRRLLTEHYGIEEQVLAGGQEYRQIIELVQNGADAVLEHYHNGNEGKGRIEVILTDKHLYVANTGAPVGEVGFGTMLSSHASHKRGDQIGRFGLGFKSLLRLGGPIDVFTRKSGTVRFDPERCRKELREEFCEENAPGLRLAWYGENGADGDEIVNQCCWAETIVRTAYREEDREPLSHEIRHFSAEFGLFLQVDVELRLMSSTAEPVDRLIRVKREGENVVLEDNGNQTQWRLFQKVVDMRDVLVGGRVGSLFERDTVPLTWAVPLDNPSEQAGHFWAFFPTKTPTRLPGILNAPWQVEFGLNALVPGAWNKKLMREAAILVISRLPHLVRTNDPGSVIDYFPRRIEEHDETAVPLVDSCWELIEQAEVVPDALGELKRPAVLMRHPVDDMRIVYHWTALAGKDSRRLVVHPDCLKRQRASRLNHLADRYDLLNNGDNEPRLKTMQPAEWFSAIASSDATKSLAVLKLAKSYMDQCRGDIWFLTQLILRIIPDRDEVLRTSGEVIIAPRGEQIPGVHAVSDNLCDLPDAVALLQDVMNVQTLDANKWIEYMHLNQHGGWKFWEICRRAPREVSIDYIRRNQHAIPILRRDQQWKIPEEVLLPGQIVSEDDECNLGVTPDLRWQEFCRDVYDIALLADVPSFSMKHGVFYEVVRWDGQSKYQEWLDEMRTRYCQELPPGRRPQLRYIVPVDIALPSGWMLLTQLRNRAKASLTTHLLMVMENNPILINTTVGHATIREYGRYIVQHPLWWYVLSNGSVMIGEMAVPLIAAMNYHDKSYTKTQVPYALSDIFVKEWLQVTPTVLLREDHNQIFWHAMMEVYAHKWYTQEAMNLWRDAAAHSHAPTHLYYGETKVTLKEIYVTTSHDLGRNAVRSGIKTVVLDIDTRNVWVAKGASNLDEMLIQRYEDGGPPERFTSYYPEFIDVLSEVGLTGMCRMVANLTLENIRDEVVLDQTACLVDGVLLLDGHKVSRLPLIPRMTLVIDAIEPAGWLKINGRAAKDLLANGDVESRRAAVKGADGSSLEERLLRAMGGHRQRMLGRLGRVADWYGVEACDDQQLASLLIDLQGPALLPHISNELEEQGLNPPKRWGTQQAREFVKSIGFPTEYALSQSKAREPELTVNGPVDLPPLHWYQEEVLEGLSQLLADYKPRRRAVVSLPTGAGKTRVMVEAAISTVLLPVSEQRSVLWIAQSDELCEQAVQAFRAVWLNKGAEATDLRIARFWGGNRTPSASNAAEPTVVVATIQTMNSRMGVGELSWIYDAGLVVIDECHHSIAPIYTNLLRWLDAAHSSHAKKGRVEPPIIGLSATPLRADEDETARLASRYDNVWLPDNQERLHAALRREGVLSETEFVELKTESQLTAEEKKRLQSLPTPWQGLEFENIIEDINVRLAGDETRNELIVDAVRTRNEEKVLLFANSVAHAEEMSVRLNLAGIRASAVSGSTTRAARRYFLDKFQRGDTRVLCNHSVLTTGFDAPKTDMILISRQVFSRVRYMQMVGRGLRGVKNGGTLKCRIVTVIDNLENFAEMHPYQYCAEYYHALPGRM